MIELLQMGNATFNGHIKANETTAARRFFHLIFFFVCKVGRFCHSRAKDASLAFSDPFGSAAAISFMPSSAAASVRFGSERIGVNCALLNNGPTAGFEY